MAPRSNPRRFRCPHSRIQTNSELLAACDDIGVFSLVPGGNSLCVWAPIHSVQAD